MNNIARAGDDYFIIEKIIPNSTLSLPLTASIYQIYRVVFNVSTEYELYLDNERVDTLSPTFKQTVKYMFGYETDSRKTENKKILLTFAGHYSSLITVPESSIVSIPNFLTTPKIISNALFNFGIDDIRNIKLYGNPKVIFYSANGGLDSPIAIAKYNKKNNQLSPIKNINELSHLMQSLTPQG